MKMSAKFSFEGKTYATDNYNADAYRLPDGRVVSVGWLESLPPRGSDVAVLAPHEIGPVVADASEA